MSFAIYLIGFVIIIAGLAWGLVLAGVPQIYVGITCLIVLGIGIVTGVAKTRTRDISN